MRRPERVAEMLKEEISEIVGFELEDPRVQAVTVTEVRVSDNLRDARVFVMVEGNEQEIQTALVALRHAAPYVRKQVGFALNLRHAPEIHFVRDTVEEKGARVDQLLNEIEREWQTQGTTEDSPERKE
ncbi:MAG: 30S ribosome-binding factor RbfA [Acidobacteria bacterium]|nr:30S ribosome-binding factor RbfA [Acidobacteriota bacterium]